MGMKLLKKSEIDQKKASERQREIDEGAKLARRVDNLREVAAAEETSLASFRIETVKSIHDEITTYSQRRDSIKQEVEILEEKRRIALKPLDEERSLLAVQKTEVESLRAGADERISSAGKVERAAAEAKRDADTILQRANAADARGKTRLFEAEQAEAKAVANLAAYQASIDALEERKVAIDQELLHRENIVATREQDVTLREKEALAAEMRLADGWILLRDRQAMLEHELKRARK